MFSVIKLEISQKILSISRSTAGPEEYVKRGESTLITTTGRVFSLHHSATISDMCYQVETFVVSWAMRANKLLVLHSVTNYIFVLRYKFDFL
jgi:hypothetical protein